MNLGQTSVYRYFDASGALLYVGITCRGTKRMSEHADTKRWWTRAVSCTVEHYPSRDEALARESYLIAALQPPFNTQGKKARNVPFKAAPSRSTEERVGPCATCGAHDHLSRGLGLCRSCEGRRGRAVQGPPSRSKKLPGVAGDCRACSIAVDHLSTRGLCRSCEGKAGRIIQKIKESA